MGINFAGIDDLKRWCYEHNPEYAVILGSGIRFPIDAVGANSLEIPYELIPGFGKPTVKGHPGVLRLITLNGRGCIVFAGRRHIYEGVSFEDVARPVRFAKELGIHKMILTNSAGALNPVANVGDIVLLEDFIMPFDIGMPEGTGFAFEVKTSLDEEMMRSIRQAAKLEAIPLKMGIYIFMPGPAYETPAEVRMLREWGADVVGMSTAPEWWAARRAGMAVAGLSIVTNVHGSIAPPTHVEVLEAAQSAGGKLARILNRVVRMT